MAKSKKSESTMHDPSAVIKVAVKPENVHNVKASDFRTVYSNNVSFNLSAFDMSFVFGEILGVEGEIITVEQKVKVTMSPQHAKVFTMVLLQNLQNYEQNIGPLSLPPGITGVVRATPSNGKSKED